MLFKTGPTCQGKEKEFRCVCVSVWMWMWMRLEQGVEVEAIFQPLFSRQSKPSLGVRAYPTPLPSISPLPLFEFAWTGSYTSFSIYTPDQQAHRAHSERNPMHQPLRNAAVTLQTQRGEAADGVFSLSLFFMNWFMKESSVTALRLLMLTDRQRVRTFIDDALPAKSDDGARAGSGSVAKLFSLSPFRWPRWSM